jgi:HEAT repeat protein
MFELRPLPRTLSAALRDIVHAKPAVRRSAIADLARLAENDEQARLEAVAALLEVLNKDSDLPLRAEAALALADAQAHSAVPALIDAARQAHPRLQQMAILALGELAQATSPALLDVLKRASQADLPALRFQALIAAAKLRLPDLAARVAKALADADEAVRYIALRVSDEHWTPAELPKALRAPVNAALSDPAFAVRVGAALMLADDQNTAAREALVQAINRALVLPAAEDQQALFELAGELGLVDAAPGLRREAWGRFGLMPGRCAWQARVALVRLGDAAAQRHLRKALASRRQDVRTLAVVAAGQARFSAVRAEIEALQRAGRVDPQVSSDALKRMNE